MRVAIARTLSSGASAADTSSLRRAHSQKCEPFWLGEFSRGIPDSYRHLGLVGSEGLTTITPKVRTILHLVLRLLAIRERPAGWGHYASRTSSRPVVDQTRYWPEGEKSIRPPASRVNSSVVRVPPRLSCV